MQAASYFGKPHNGRRHKILSQKSRAGPKHKNIFGNRFSILRVKKCLAGPRVAALQRTRRCDEWNHNSDEPNGKFTIYPLASEND
jgi:hypothetical protein